MLNGRYLYSELTGKIIGRAMQVNHTPGETMMRVLLTVSVTVILLAACAPATPFNVAPPPPFVQNTNSPTATLTPTATRIPSTPTITPLPTIPAFVPTFDVRTIVTATPAPAAACPKEDPTLVPDFQIPDPPSCISDGRAAEECFPRGMENKYLDYLNDGGSVRDLLDRYLSLSPRPHFYQDVTGDGVAELMLYDTAPIPRPQIYYCEDGQFHLYTFLSERGLGFWTGFHGIDDMNVDDIPEVIFTWSGCSGSGCLEIAILEWNGQTFQDISPRIGMMGVKEWHIQDGQNGTKEIVVTGDMPGSCCYNFLVPWRWRTDTFGWDGNTFSLYKEDFATPEYRYQAVQDADRKVLSGEYSKALQLYRNAIFNERLEWWSAEQRQYLIDKYYRSFGGCSDDCGLISPEPDISEYPRLAAYAYYRIMLLQIVQGRATDASVTYATMQHNFGNDPYGRSYAEMAKSFWDAYQAGSKISDGCAAGIDYATQHPEILDPLFGGSSQDHLYKPEDVCPFR